jgi:hypothetical protein
MCGFDHATFEVARREEIERFPLGGRRVRDLTRGYYLAHLGALTRRLLAGELETRYCVRLRLNSNPLICL